jgi:hypothetical protein
MRESNPKISRVSLPKTSIFPHHFQLPSYSYRFGRREGNCELYILVITFSTKSYFSPLAQQPQLGQGLLIIEASRSHSVGLLWTSDQPDEQTYTWQTHKDSQKTHFHPTLPSMVFEPAIPASELLQTHALDRAATGIATNLIYLLITNTNTYY